MSSSRSPCCSAAIRDLTLVEVVVCPAILALVFGGIIAASVRAGYRAEWVGYNLSAQPIEQVKLR
jgi:predicted DNA-binding transcriptional regulator